MTPDDRTDEMPGGPDEPTEVNPAGDEPTGRIPEGNDNPTDVLPEGPPTEAHPGRGGPSEVPPGADAGGTGGRGFGVLLGAILASLALVAAYAVAGGPVGPDKAADPCEARAWTDPQNFEEAAQQFALSAADGAACELGVTREELTRSIADDQALEDFKQRHGVSDQDLEEALRAGLNRAVDDAENAGALSGLAAAGIRAAIRIMPMSVMIDLIENAEGIFNGDFGSLGEVGDAIDAITSGIESLDSGTGEDPLRDVGDAIEGALPEGTTDQLEELVPPETRERFEDEARKRLEQGLNDLLAP